MLSSTTEYLEALRKGNYLLFLEWPLFVLKRYSTEDEIESTDFLMDCLVFEWLQQGTGEQDAQYMALLYAVYEINPCPLVGQLEFNLMSIYSALFVCLSLQKKNLYGHVLPSTEMTGTQLSNFMSQMTVNSDSNEHGLIRDELIQQSQTIDPLVVKAVYKKINDIRKPVLTMEKYVELLGWDQRSQRSNMLCDTRKAIAQSLLSFLRKQEDLTDDVRFEIAISIEAIREKQPMEWEGEFLDTLSPSTLKMKAIIFAHSLRSRFFAIVSPSGQQRREENEARIESSLK